MRGVRCSWVEMGKVRQLVAAMERGDAVNKAEVKCVTPTAISDWKRASEVMNVLDEAKLEYSDFESFQPSHAMLVAKYYRKLKGKAADWDEDTKDEIVGWVETCEDKKWTVDQLKAELKIATRSEPPESDRVVVSSLQDLVDAGKQFGCIYADPPWKYGNQRTRAATEEN